MPMYYVCEIGRAFGILAGPFKTEPEAIAASGAIEIEQPQLRARTEVWSFPQPGPDNIAAAMALPGTPTMPVAVH